jgi:hypothetical protein
MTSKYAESEQAPPQEGGAFPSLVVATSKNFSSCYRLGAVTVELPSPVFKKFVIGSPPLIPADCANPTPPISNNKKSVSWRSLLHPDDHS